MSRLAARPQQRLLVLAILVAAVLFAGVDAQQHILQPHGATRHQRRLQGRFLHITDLHPDELYKAHSSTEEGIACHRKTGHAGSYGAEKTDCDSPFSLVNATFDWIQAHVKDDVDFIIWTGDSARHDSDEKNPRDSSSVLRTNRILADKLVDAVAGKHGKLDVPVIPTFGNNDFLPHNIFYPGPNKWLHAYSDIWRRFIPEAQRHSFEFGGWFYVEAIPDHLAVFSLNTMYFFDRNAGVDGCKDPSEPGFRHMEWLRIQLQLMRERNMKAILIGHVPPARTSSKQNWDETCWQRYTLWLRQFRDVVAGSVYGHMNIDHFLLQDTKELNILSEAGTQRSSKGDESALFQSEDNDAISIQSKGDYLQELREVWSNLPSSIVRALALEEDVASAVDQTSNEVENNRNKKKKKKNYKKIGGRYAERYQLSLVSPSVVPNYFPTLRIVEYNISGLEDVDTWVDPFSVKAASTLAEQTSEDIGDETGHLELRQDSERDVAVSSRRGKKHKKPKKPKGPKGPKGPKDPHLTVPDGPPKSSLPGPAYKMQPFTFTGYTQYFANLTYINNDAQDSALGGAGWRVGDHEPNKLSHKPKPREFRYEVEYSTFKDKIFKLNDLTVKSYVKLAYRIAKKRKGKAKTVSVEDMDLANEAFDDEDEVDDDPRAEDGGSEVSEDADDDFEDDDDDDDIDDDEEEDDESEPHFGSSGKKKRRRKKKNKVWVHFLSHAFVKTVPEKELKKM